MVWAISSFAIVLAAAAEAPPPPPENTHPAAYEATFAPPQKSERSFAALRPAGPYYQENAIRRGRRELEVMAGGRPGVPCG